MADKTYTVTVASGNLYGGGTGNVYYIDGTRSSSGPGQYYLGRRINFAF